MAWAALSHSQDFSPSLLAEIPLAGLGSMLVRHAPLVFLLALQLYAVGVAGEEADAKCSKALGFNETSGPKDRSFQDLQFCEEHHKRTCCERNHTRQALVSFALWSHDRSQRCSQMGRLAVCGICDGDVGVGAKARLNSVLLCPSFCQHWFRACQQDFFAPSGSGGLQPCNPGSLVCSPLGEITEDSTSFCSSVGFSVAESEDEDVCFDGVPAATSRGKAERAPYTRPQGHGPPWWRQYISERLISDQHLWRMQREMEEWFPTLCLGFALVFGCWYLFIAQD